MRINKYLLLVLICVPNLSWAASGTSEGFLQDLERVLGSSLANSTGSSISSSTSTATTIPTLVVPKIESSPVSRSNTPRAPLIPIDLPSAPPAPISPSEVCTLPSIDWMYVREEKGVSDLRWPAVKWANGYNLYKKAKDQSWILVETLANPAYRIHLAPWAVVYEDFAVRALCAPDKESSNVSGATSVQTGPLLWILILLSLTIGGYISYRYTSARNSTETR